MKEAVKTKKILIFSIISATVAFFLFGFMFWQIKIQNESIALLASEAQKSSAKNDAVRTTRLLFDKNKDSLDRIDSFFISKDGVVDFINSIDLLGKERNVELTIGELTSEIDQKIKDDFKETLKLRIDASGSWGSIIDFLTALENLPYKITVDEVSVGLLSASDKLSFTNASSTNPEVRKPGDAEEWKATYTISIIKLR